MKKFVLLSLLLLCSCQSTNKIDLDEFNRQKITVSVSGAVINSGEYQLEVGDTLSTLLDKAVLSNDANLELINKLTVLKDKDQIYIPFVEENDERISLNFSDITDLCKIPGVGEKTALKIIEYRNTNGFFQSLEDIKKIKGIGEKKYQKMKDYIKL